ncbi:MAG: type II secretion system secretin GspD [Myxococcaceae bacterium]|nr:type II secretion system secretin GspD [Myxococcaceae bacterium]
MHPFALLLLLATTSPPEPKESCETLRRNARFSVHFERVELAKLAQTISDATCKTFIVSDTVKGAISLVGPENSALTLDAEQLYAAFLAALDVNGLTVVRQGRLWRIIEKPRARQHPVPLLFDGAPFPAPEEVVSRLFHLQHAELEPTRAVLAQLVGQGGDLLAIAPDLLLATDSVANLQRLEALLKTLDTPRAADVTRLVTVRHADAADLADKVTRLVVPKAPGRTPETLTVATDERTNRLLLVGAESLVTKAEGLVAQLDVEVPGDGKARVYRLKNADAKDIAAALEGLTQRAGKPGAPGATVTGDVRITANEPLNALVIVASAGDYRSLVEVIEALDQPVRQVFIETVIMEVNVDRESQLGLSVHGVAGTSDVPVVFGSQPTGAPSSLSLKSLAGGAGLLAGVQGPVLTGVSKALGFDVSAFGIALQAVQTDSDANVLSTPYILTTDNKEAEIVVGQRVPFQQGTSSAALQSLLTSGNSAAATTLSSLGSVSRERVELKLAVKPHIGDGDHVRLEINQSAEEISGQNSLGPITSTRSQKTAVVAQDGQTLVLGGIMQDRDVEGVSKTPLLGDIPVLGHLFRNTTHKKTKVNLLVFLTPHIVRDASDIDRLVEKKTEERRRLLERTYGGTAGYDAPIDYARRRGPLSALWRAVDREQRRPENGGSGELQDTLIAPGAPAP